MFFLKIYDIERINKNIEQLLATEEMSQNILDVIKYFMKFLYIAHIFACIWNLLGNQKYYDEN